MLVWSRLSEAERAAALARPGGRSDPALRAKVAAIVEDVRVCGWDGLADWAERIDGAAPRRVPVVEAAEEARRTLSTAQLRAIELARRNIARFHAKSLPGTHEVETMAGVTVRKVWRPVERIGLYIPGGAAPLFSTLMMLAIPARAAGVGEIVVATPPRADGGLDPVIGLAADLCGIASVWTMGGAQAIAALAFGAGEIPRVAKICGPGNAWVAEAKAYVAGLPGGPAIDMPAGPSELLVIADDSANPRTVAADLLSQAEHDADAQVILVATSAQIVAAVRSELDAQVESLPLAAVARASLGGARFILAGDAGEAVGIANAYAPEHLSLAVADPEPLVGLVRNAGAVFAGHQAAETFGDYLAGSSHVLPTDGAARAAAGPAALLARLEGLEAHARAADARAEAAA